MLYLNEIGVEVLKNKISNTKIEAYWDNYSFIVWKPDSAGYHSTKGIFRNNQWGIASMFHIGQNGFWSFPKQYVRFFK